MFRVTKEYGETPEEIKLVSGDVLLTVTKVEGSQVTGWFYCNWWNTEVAVSLLKNTPCIDTEDCKCADCLIGDGLTYASLDDEEQELTVETRRATKIGDHIVVSALFGLVEIEGCEDIHGWDSATLERTVSSRSHIWTEWKALITGAQNPMLALHSLEEEKENA